MEWKTSTAAWLLDLHSTRGPLEAGAFGQGPRTNRQPLCEHMCE